MFINNIKDLDFKMFTTDDIELVKFLKEEEKIFPVSFYDKGKKTFYSFIDCYDLQNALEDYEEREEEGDY